MNDYSKSDLPHDISPPDYSTLLKWWDCWPEARPELLDFWGRGNFTRRLVSRKTLDRPSCLVRVEYVDEIESSLKRLALLDMEVDFAWCGTTFGPSLVMLPQDGAYEDSGGWGYLVAAGSKFKEQRGGKEWYPSFAWATLLPDTVTDWLLENAHEFIEAGKIVVCPANNIGLQNEVGYLSEEHIQRISNYASITKETAKIETLFSLELPFIEGMSLSDIHKFCEDYKDSLVLFQNALSNLIKNSIEHEKQEVVKELISQIRHGVAELTLSDKAIKARRIISTLGASISTFLITIGVKLGVDLGAAALGSTGAAMATLAFWFQILESRWSMRKNPFYIVWALQKGKHTENFRRERAFLKEFALPQYSEQKEIPPHHWLTPPTGGWLIPSAKARI